MRILLVTVLFSVLWPTIFSYKGHKVLRVQPVNDKDLKCLIQLRNVEDIDVWSKISTNKDPVDIMVPPQLYETIRTFLKSHKIGYTVIINDVAKVLEGQTSKYVARPQSKQGKISFRKYNDFNEINAYIKRLARDYPKTVSIEKIGRSFEGRDLNVIKISKNPLANNPVIFIDSGMHAREWMAPAQTTYIIQQLVEKPENSFFLDNVDWYILPVLNPDGYQYTHDSLHNRLWRKTRSRGRACIGVDGNRNFDFFWGTTGTSGNECSDVYRGPFAFSETETNSFADYIWKNRANIKLYLSFHAYGNYILFPWGYTEQLPNDLYELQKLGELVASAIRRVNGTTYTVGSSSNVLYTASGGSDDWVKGVAGIPLSFTIELTGSGVNGFDPSSLEILSIVSETWEGVKAFHRYILRKFG